MPENVNSPERLRWEGRLVQRARRGDRRAFAELYEAFSGPLFARVLLPRLGDRAAAEDALAETFRTALERLGQFEHQGVSIWFWLMRIGKNKAMDMHRARERTGRALTNYDGLFAPLRDDPEVPGTGLERREEDERLRRAVAEVLERLNPRYRRVIELRFLEDKSRVECAESMDVKLGTLDVLVLRALRAFRKAWDELHAEEDRT